MGKPIMSECGKWRLVAAKGGTPNEGFYGFTYAEVLLATGVLPRANEVQDLIDHAAQLLDEAAGIFWPERIYRVLGRIWVYRVVDGIAMYIPVKRVRAVANDGSAEQTCSSEDNRC